MRNPQDISLGHVANTQQSVIFPKELRKENLYVVGMPNMGKSKLLEDLARQIMTAWPWTGEAFILIDPHGNLVDSIVAWLSQQELERLATSLDQRRREWVLPFHPLQLRVSLVPGVHD